MEHCLNNNFLCLKKEKEKWWSDLFKQLNSTQLQDQIESKSNGYHFLRSNLSTSFFSKNPMFPETISPRMTSRYTLPFWWNPVTLSPMFASGTTPFLPNSLQGLLSHSLSLLFIFFFLQIKMCFNLFLVFINCQLLLLLLLASLEKLVEWE